jgi:elongin-A
MDNRPKDRVRRLTDIARNKIIQHVGAISDVGITPFHLLQPILVRMNAKQLGSIEALSPQLIPHTDPIWKQLVAKDFPSRLDSLPLDLASKPMPYKALYTSYSIDRDNFKRDSVERLRSMNARIKSEKSVNKVVVVSGLLREPVIRRRKPTNQRLNYYPGKPNSILSKAKRDLQLRPALFGHCPQKYDPYAVFNNQSFSNQYSERTNSPKINSRNKPIHHGVLNNRTPGLGSTNNNETRSPARKSVNEHSVSSRKTENGSDMKQEPHSNQVSPSNSQKMSLHEKVALFKSNQTKINQASPTKSTDCTLKPHSASATAPRPSRSRPPSIFMPQKRPKLHGPQVRRKPPPPPVAEEKPITRMRVTKSSIFK